MMRRCVTVSIWASGCVIGQGTMVLVAGAGLGYLGWGRLIFLPLFCPLFSLPLSGETVRVTETLLKYC